MPLPSDSEMRYGDRIYLAPEQVEGLTHGQAVDYWSCGVAGLELLLGKVVGSRTLPSHRLAQYQDYLREFESPLDMCALAMLQLDPETGGNEAVAAYAE